MKKILIILPMILIIGLTGCQEKKLAYPEGSSKHTFDYNVIVSALNTLILGFIAWRAFETTRRYNHSLIRPNIFANNLIKKDLYNPDSYNYIWTLGNTSKHPAINMLIRHTINKEENGKTRIIGATKWVSCSTLAGEQSIELFWINHAYSIEICYTDISGDKYYLSTVGALMVKTRKLKKKNYDHYVQEAIDNRSNNIVTLKSRWNSIYNRTFDTYIAFLKEINLLETDYDPNIKIGVPGLDSQYLDTTAPPDNKL